MLHPAVCLRLSQKYQGIRQVKNRAQADLILISAAFALDDSPYEPYLEVALCENNISYICVVRNDN